MPSTPSAYRWLVLLSLLLCAACIPSEGSAHIRPEIDCATVLNQQQQPPQPDAIVVVVAASAHREFCWQLYGPVLAAQKSRSPAIRVIYDAHDMIGSSYQQVMEQALVEHKAPDLMQFAAGKLASFAERGYLISLDDCRQHYATFDNILEPAWPSVTWNGHIWGMPFRIGFFMFYYNKQILLALGWPPKRIDQLPQMIERGEFTLDDLATVAHAAVTTGIVQPGFGFWPYLDDPWSLQLTYVAYGGRIFDATAHQLVINKAALIKAYTFHRHLFTTGITHQSFADLDHSFLDKTMWEDAVVHGRVLFWMGISANWSWLTTEYRDDIVPGDDPAAMLGYALYPSGIPGQPGHVLWDSGTSYVIPSEKGSGRRQQAAACALLAQTLTPEINALYIARGGHMSILKSQASDPAFQSDPFDLAQFQMWPYGVELPANFPEFARYTATLNSYLDRVQTGALAADVAAELVISQLGNQLGDKLIVE